MYDMDFRDYDPAIARWVVLDPVVHHSLSPYNAFDNNPVFWADPSGADSQTLFDLEGGKHTVSDDDVVNLWKSSDSNEVTLDGIFGYFNLDYTPEGNFDGSQKSEEKSLYKLFVAVLNSKVGTSIDIKDAIKKYGLDNQLKDAVNSIKLVDKNKIFVDWKNEKKINSLSFINVKDGVLNFKKVSLPVGDGKFYNGYSITGGGLQVDTGTMFSKGNVYSNVFLSKSGSVSGIISSNNKKNNFN